MSSLSSKAPLTVSVVIPVYNGGDAFRRCLQSLHTGLIPNEVIVVSDADTDGSWRVAEEFGAKVIRCSANRGPATARNIGAKAAQGDIIFFVDADVTLHPETIHRVVEVFDASPQTAALIGSYDDAPGATNFLSQYRNLFHHYTHQVSSEEASTFWGACGAVRREVFFQVGGFDQAYRAACVEDIELGYRLKQHGYSIRLCKHIQVKHLKCWKPVSMLKADIFYRALPWTALILRHQQLNNDLNLDTSSRLSVILAFALLLSFTAVGLWPSAFGFSLAIAGLLFLLNAPVYRFFRQKRGLRFTARVIPWHWLYFLYSGLAFAVGLGRHHLSQATLVKRRLVRTSAN
ncbi:MAG: glycosyltransferase family 2 protein [Leptolyngbyaceae cyanobacterium SM1_1_3]|nr:glycosyltransferase family 2 protein [Leptolyngbyaceae cyanobacterium SM1_1_3]NJN02237.1 glycosyltransferase family 2 protein [Leptolyngbyaceae cyanobacterium RM1_1_2]NJO08482.1 glycosyltransferase family 2 protein [Leptolyngbyaceae cyanobacterium SL_1_1]